jgi:hypothetical protein
MNDKELARELVGGGLLHHIETEIQSDYFNDWILASVPEDREQIHAKIECLEMVVYKIKELAKEGNQNAN